MRPFSLNYTHASDEKVVGFYLMSCHQFRVGFFWCLHVLISSYLVFKVQLPHEVVTSVFVTRRDGF